MPNQVQWSPRRSLCVTVGMLATLGSCSADEPGGGTPSGGGAGTAAVAGGSSSRGGAGGAAGRGGSGGMSGGTSGRAGSGGGGGKSTPTGGAGGEGNVLGGSGGKPTTGGSAGSGAAGGGGGGTTGGAGAGSGTAGGAGAGSGTAGGAGAGMGGGSGGPSGGGGSPAGSTAAGDLAVKLGRPRRFLVGLGNDIAGADKQYDHDKDGIWSLESKLDLHYAYLSGTGWPDYNPGGLYVNIVADSAKKHGVIPMFTLYQMATLGDGNLAGLADAGFMKDYWAGAKLLFQRLAVFGDPAVVHLEPDFLGYVFQQAKDHDPKQLKTLVGSVSPDCQGLPEDVTGWGGCLVKLARTYAPKAVIGFHASGFGATTAELAGILEAVHEKEADFFAVDPLDRDAGCFEAKLAGLCERSGSFYWDEENKQSPNFHEHFAYVKGLHDVLQKPVIWWQIPLGRPSDKPGGVPGAYRDNRVHYFFSHPEELVAVGGVAAVFGVGAGQQTYLQSDGGSDGGQFNDATKKYYQTPTPLP